MDTTKGTGGKMEARKKKTKGINPYVPDDIITNILCRLPPKYASQCRFVCKRWRDLILSRNFVDLHFRRHSNIPLILVANPTAWFCHKFHLLLDKRWEPTRKKLMIHTFPLGPTNIHTEYQPLFSHAGLVVFREPNLPGVIMFNPIYLEKVTISFSRGRKEIYGVFFHPLFKEYCSLWKIHAPWDQSKPIQYKMLSLGSSPFMKTIYNPFIHRVKKRYSHPVFIDDKYLYWMIESEEKMDSKFSGYNDIMQFDIIGEEFSVKPCPVPVDTECNSDQTYLLNIDGTLSFLVIFPSKITIWSLKDQALQLWTAANYILSTENFVNTPKPFAVVDGNLALVSHRRLIVCNLMQGTMKYFRKYNYAAVFLSHQVSLASLKNCQSIIHLDENGRLKE